MTGNMKIGNRIFTFGKKVYIMGILNVTPDSFSDGGKFDTLEHAMAQAEKMIKEGADLIDVGGESTRPGHQQITEDEEIARVVPVIQKIKEKYDIPVSIDTYKSRVAEAALEAGADMLNDIWGFLYDEKMAELAARYDVPVCLMHNRDNTEYQDFVPDVVADLKKCLAVAEKYGVKKENIMLDPGVGFGKTYEQNLAIINHLEVLCDMGYPVLLATSRKSVIGLTLDLPVTEREEGTIATSVIGAMKGCDFVRVHDVQANARALRMTEAIMYGKEKEELNWDYVKEELKKLHLSQFEYWMRQLSEVWFGTEKTTPLYDELTEFIVDSGTYGTIKNYHASHVVELGGKNQNLSVGKIRSKLEIIFLPYEGMQEQYLYLEKFPFLLPVAWIQRIFRTIVWRKDKITSTLQSTNIEQDRLEKVKKVMDALELFESD